MENKELTSIITQGLAELSIALPHGALDAFEIYYDFLEERSRSFNLTSISGVVDVARLHFLDCIALLNSYDFKASRVIDIGSGAGFPGIPLKIVEPSLDLTLLDSTGKRISFLSELCLLLETSVVCINARAEDAGRDPDMRESYDIAVSRAVAELNVLCELCLPFVRTGGVFVSMKGANCAEEIASARRAVSTLGAEVQDCYDYAIPGTEIKRRAVIIRKVSPTPGIYPRRFATVKKRPL